MDEGESMSDNTIAKTYKYRMYPSKTQEQILDNWIRICRSVYNLCVEQRKTLFELYSHQPMSQELNEKGFQFSIPKNRVSPIEDPRRYTNWAMQCREVTLLRKEFPEYSQVPSDIMSKVPVRVEQAFKKYYDNMKNFRIGKITKFPLPPKFSSRFDDFSLLYMRNNGFEVQFLQGDNMARIFGFPKMKQGIKVRYHTPIKGNVTQQQIKKEGNYWYLCVSAEDTKVLPKPNRPSVGVDLGIIRTVQLSDGTYKNLSYDKLAELLARKKVLQRRLKRKVGGNRNKKEKQSNNFKKAYQKIAKLDRKITNIRQNELKKIATQIARNNEVVVVEALKVKNMTKSAKGTNEKPGNNVKAKSGLNRSILLTSPYFFKTFLKSKCNEFSSIFIEVNPAYTSQTCSSCDHIDKENRKSQAKFKCTACGFELNADHNGAINILKKGTAA